MSTESCGDLLQFLVGFDVPAEFEPANGGPEMIKVWGIERLHEFIRASHEWFSQNIRLSTSSTQAKRRRAAQGPLQVPAQILRGAIRSKAAAAVREDETPPLFSGAS